MTASSTGALRGLRVLDTATHYGAPFITTLLADHGADVVKVEPPGGDSYRRYPSRVWPIVARGKRSVVLDLRTEDGCEAVRRLARVADVVVVNMPPDVLEKRGLDYPSLSAGNPGLIVAAVTGFGLDGPYRDRPGNGTLAEAYSGLTHMTGNPEGAPVLASLPLGDAVTAMIGAFGVLAACYDRLAHGGPGQLIDVNPLDALLQLTGPTHTEYDGRGAPPVRLASRVPGSAVRNVFPTADGQWVAISCSTVRHVEDLARLAGHPDTDGAGTPTGDIDTSVAAWTATLTRDAVVAALVAARVPVAPVYSARDCREDPHMRARGCIQLVETEEYGPVASPAPAPRLIGTPSPFHARTPALGEVTVDDVAAAWGAGRPQ